MVLNIPWNVNKFLGMLKKMPGSFTKDSAEFLGNVQESFGESKCQFVS